MTALILNLVLVKYILLTIELDHVLNYLKTILLQCNYLTIISLSNNKLEIEMIKDKCSSEYN